jgi:hypothetical protein
MSSTDKEKIQALEAQLLDLQGQLEAERAGHERYRELTRTNLAEMSWKKDNDTLRAKLESAIKELEWYSNPANFVIHEDTNACEPDHEGDLYPLGARARIVLDKLKRDPFPDTDNSILKARLSAARQAFHDIATALTFKTDTALGRSYKMLQEIAQDGFEVLEGKRPVPGSLVHDDLNRSTHLLRQCAKMLEREAVFHTKWEEEEEQVLSQTKEFLAKL